MSTTAYKTREEWLRANPLRRWRDSEGISQVELARTLDVHESTIRYWELGRRTPSSPHMATLAKVTGDRELPTRLYEWNGAVETLETNWL